MREGEWKEGREKIFRYIHVVRYQKNPPKTTYHFLLIFRYLFSPLPLPLTLPLPHAHTQMTEKRTQATREKRVWNWSVTGGFSGYIPSCAWLSGQFDMIRSFVNFSVSFLTFGGLLPSHIYYVFPDKIICPPVPSFLLGVTGAKKNLANPITKKWKEPTAPITCLFVCSFVSSEKPI